MQHSHSPDARVVILGAGHAGGSVASFLRQYGFQGPITLVGEEPIPPYQRPLQLKAPEWYGENGVTLRLSTRAEAIDRSAREVRLSSGETVPYDVLVLATGAGRAPCPCPARPWTACSSCARRRTPRR